MFDYSKRFEFVLNGFWNLIQGLPLFNWYNFISEFLKDHSIINHQL